MTSPNSQEEHRQEEPRSISTILEEDDHGLPLSTEPENEENPISHRDEDELEEEDVQSLLAVSISRAQSRLTSPRTPAAEKAAALEHLDGGGLFDNIHSEFRDENSDLYNGSTAVQAPSKDLPSPWRAGPKAYEKSLAGITEHKDAAPVSHHRNSSASIFSGTDNAFRRLMANPLPSLPKASTFTNLIPSQIPFFASSNGPEKSQPSSTRTKRSSTLFSNTPLPWNVFSNKSDSQSSVTTTPNQNPSAINSRGTHLQNGDVNSANFTKINSGSIRRVNSDGSLRLSQNLSRVSSLGDDAHFHGVQGQVNSRLKAIKDSFADSSFRFPSKFNGLLPQLDIMAYIRLVKADPPKAMKLNNFPVKPPFSTERALYGDQNMDGHDGRSTLASIAYAPENKPQSHLQAALENLTGDIVVLGGYRGSVLRSAKPPHRQLWAPVKVGLGIRKVDLEVGLDHEAEENMKNTIIPAGMLTHIGPVDISRRLLKRLRQCENSRKGLLRVWNYGYDWRLSPHLLSQYLSEFLESLPSNQPGVPSNQRGATVIAHSLGGLITRHAINRDPSLVKGVLYASVPQSCVNILGPLRNGDDVLLTSRVLTAQVNFTLRTSYALLPESGTCFFNKESGEEYKVNFFDIDTWINHRLSPCVVSPFPPPDQPMAGLGSLIGSISSNLPSLSISAKRTASSNSQDSLQRPSTPNAERAQIPHRSDSPSAGEEIRDKVSTLAETAEDSGNATLAPQMGNVSHTDVGSSKNNNNTFNPTVSTLDIREAIIYLQRTLKDIEKFKKELNVRPELVDSDTYPPIAVLYGKTIPTVKGARVTSVDAIKYSNAYDDLIFGAGDGVVLAKEAMVPDGYTVARGGRISSDRGHVTLLGDLEGVGKCLLALQNASDSKIGISR